MKEIYLTSDNIEQVAKEMIESVEQSSQLKQNLFEPEHSALLVLDMQKYFLDETSHAFVSSAPAIVKNIQLLISNFRKQNLPVVFTKHINNETNSKLMSVWWNDMITEDSAMSEIIPEFDTSGFQIIKKSQYDSFFETNLEEYLLNKNVEQIIITGVMTHLCCESTARSAFIRGFKVIFPANATATYNRRFHFSSLLNLSHGFANIVLTDEIIERLNEQNN